MPPRKKTKSNWTGILQTLLAAVAGGAATSVATYATSVESPDVSKMGTVALVGAAVGVAGLYSKRPQDRGK